MRRGAAIVTLAIALAIALTAPAAAHDSLAPRDADHRWLPPEQWVRKHWMPFEEARLYSLLRVNTRTVFRWLANDHRTLMQLARRQGVRRSTLAKRLVAPRRAALSDNEYRIVRSRTQRVLTQGHLAQHVFFHVFHGSHVKGHIEHLYGVDRHEYRRLRQQRRMSAFQIARHGGKPTGPVREHTIEALRAEAAEGVRIGAMTPAQGERIVARQLRVVDCWLTRPAPKFDPHNPFGDRYAGHGPHRRGLRVGLRNPKPPKGCWKSLTEG